MAESFKGHSRKGQSNGRRARTSYRAPADPGLGDRGSCPDSPSPQVPPDWIGPGRLQVAGASCVSDLERVEIEGHVIPLLELLGDAANRRDQRRPLRRVSRREAVQLARGPLEVEGRDSGVPGAGLEPAWGFPLGILRPFQRRYGCHELRRWTRGIARVPRLSADMDTAGHRLHLPSARTRCHRFRQDSGKVSTPRSCAPWQPSRCDPPAHSFARVHRSHIINPRPRACDPPARRQSLGGRARHRRAHRGVPRRIPAAEEADALAGIGCWMLAGVGLARSIGAVADHLVLSSRS
jgi:hypothetical protein